MTRFLLMTVLTTLTAAGCASTGGTSSGGNPDLILEEEIRASDVQTQDAYTLVQRLRPRWLRARGTAGFGGDRPLPVIFVDGTRFGRIESLHDLSPVNIRRMEYIDARDATTRFGTGYPAGIIMVTTG